MLGWYRRAKATKRGGMGGEESECLIVCAGQRVAQEGSSPSGALVESAVSKSGGNASLAVACGWRGGGQGVHREVGALMWSSQHLNRYVVRKQWRCWDGRNAYSRCAADARRTTDCTSADQCRSEFRRSGGGRQVFDEDRAETTEHGGRHATAEADAFEAAPVIGGARGSLERIRRRRIVSCDRTAPWTGTVHHLSRGQRP